MLYVYLAGPVTGQTESDANNWRMKAAAAINKYDVARCVNPVRDAPKLAEGEAYDIDYKMEQEAISGSADAIRAKTRHDVTTCHIVLAYFPVYSMAGNKWPSIGTIIECARAKALGKTVVLVVPKDEPRLARHPILLDCADAVFHDLATGIAFVESLVGAYGR